jgi:thioredoxin reductase (NADPH)
MSSVYDVIIVGSGPAGLSAGLYTSRAGLSTLIMEKETIGGELMNREMIENYPGYPEGILGPDLGSNMTTQAMNYGAEIKMAEVTNIEVAEDYKLIKTPEEEYRGKAIIFTGGAHPQKLGIPGEEEFTDNGVFYCATCDGPQFANKMVAVAGGGDSGLTEALSLTRLVSKVILIELLPRLTASKVLQERALANPKFEYMCGTRIEAIQGDSNVKSIAIVNAKTGEKKSLEVDGLLVHVGLEANTGYLKNIVPLDERGQILVNEKMETQIPGIFAAGDIRHDSPMQIATAVGDGVTASLSLGKYLGIR